MASGESRSATRAARIAAAAAAAAAVLAAGLDMVENVIAVPSLPEGILRERVTVTEFRRIEDPVQKPKVEEPLIEHTADESDFKVDAKPEPEPVPPPPEPEPEPEPAVEPPPPPPPEPEPNPEPTPEPEPILPPPPAPEPPPPPKPVVKPNPAPKPAAKPAPKPVKSAPKPAVEKPKPAEEPPSEASAGSNSSARSGGAGGVSNASGNAEAGDESAALALIVREIEAHKRYPRRARQTGVEGKVVLSVEIDAAGIIRSVSLLEKHNSVLLNRAALQAADGLVGIKLPLGKAMTAAVPVVFTLR